MIFKIIALALMAVFYALLLYKLFRAEEKGIKTTQIGNGKTGFVKWVECTMMISTVLVVRKAKEYIEIPKLTPELLRVFICRIGVYEKFEKYSRTAGNPIIIHYAFRLPEQNGIPAIEVLANPTAKTA